MMIYRYFKFRADCMEDAFTFFKALGYEHINYTSILKPLSKYPDTVCSFETLLTIEHLVNVADNCDLHTISETIQLADDYTGKRVKKQD